MSNLEFGELRQKKRPSQRQWTYALVWAARVIWARMALFSPRYWG
jgi:hypothetical protein